MPAADKDEYLELFDALDLNKKSHRRCGTLYLEEYFRVILTDFGRNELDINEIHGELIQHQWGTVVTHLAAVEDFEDKEKWAKIVHKIKGLRNEVAHNTLFNPRRDSIESIRQRAENFENWLDHWSTKYEESKLDHSPRELLIQMMTNTLQEISETNFSLPEKQDAELYEKVENTRADIEDFETEGEITLELLEIFSTVKDLQNEFREFKELEAEYDAHMSSMRDSYLGR